ncbi:hypothetical protein MTR67_051748 [Solanum verrucosum]|uniref:Uncharacterized protein n=1 Tax=Solanum verrucosum TaxID=315347 RepID=A0AAF0V812_SOLVR|nr:hypothetical protein MTR67_051748 [Solanum verrucosum]
MARKRLRNSSQGELLYDSSEQQKQQIGSMSMPQSPQNWPQNERDELHDTKYLLAPLNHKDWRLVPSMYKDIIWAHIKENTDATDDMKRILMMSFGSKWKESKHEAKTIGYDPYNTDIECLAHCPDRVEEDQWRSLVHYWSSKEANKQMDDLGEVYPELNVPGSAPNDVYSQVMGSDTHGIVRTLGKGASPSLVYGPVYKRSQVEKRDFDTRVEMEVQKATSAMKIEMTEKMYEAKKEMEATDKKLLEAKEEAKENDKVMERKLSEAKMDMEEIITDKVNEGIQEYVESLGINVDASLKSGR